MGSSVCHDEITPLPQSHEADYMSPPLDFELGHETSLGNWDISRCDMNRNLMTCFLVGHPALVPSERIYEEATILSILLDPSII